MIFRQSIGGVWLIFAVFWFVAARSAKRTAERPSLNSQVVYRVLWLAGFFLLFLSGPGSRPNPVLTERLPWHSVYGAALGFALTVGGLLLALWARVTLGRNWSGSVTFKENHALVERGPYKLIRHPIYTAILVMFVGSAISLGTLGGMLGAPLLLAGVVIKSRQEEELLSRHFADAYPAYKARTKALVPLVY